MAERSSIEWTDATFNPWIGCTNVSPGCDHCYAEQQDKFRGWTPEGWGAGKPRRRTSPQLWKQPEKWNAEGFYECVDCGLRGTAQDMGREPRGPCSHGVTKQVRRRVFCASLADVFDNEVDPAWRRDLVRLISDTPNLDWLLLTKRIGNVLPMMRAIIDIPDPLPSNVWLGATIVNQEEADRDIPKLLATPARVRFLSMEPLLSDVDLSQWLFPFKPCKDCPCPDPDVSREGLEQCCRDPELMPSSINWVIAGGESGPKARPMHPAWARSLRDQCKAASVPFLFKQHGEWLPTAADMNRADLYDNPRTYGGWVRFDGSGWHRGAALADFTKDDAHVMHIGKKNAGRQLDGRTHDGFPEVACAT